MEVAPAGKAGWLGIAGSDAPAGNVGDGGAAVVPLVAGGADVPLVAVADADGARVGVAIPVGAAVVAAGATVGTPRIVVLARAVGTAVTRSVSEHAANTHKRSGAMSVRIGVLKARTPPARSARARAYRDG
jgi:hypothetical protein